MNFQDYTDSNESTLVSVYQIDRLPSDSDDEMQENEVAFQCEKEILNVKENCSNIQTISPDAIKCKIKTEVLDDDCAIMDNQVGESGEDNVSVKEEMCFGNDHAEEDIKMADKDGEFLMDDVTVNQEACLENDPLEIEAFTVEEENTLYNGGDRFDLKECDKLLRKHNIEPCKVVRVDNDEVENGLLKCSNSLKKDLDLHDRKKFKCQPCNMQFTLWTEYNKHTKTHTKKQPFVCSYCNKIFSRKDILTRHIRTHTLEKPYICQHCSKAFSRKEYLRGHTRTHTLEKPHICNYCSKGFSEKGYLTKHIRTHTREKPYICHYCSKGFSEKGSFTKHIRTHTLEKPYICQHCSKAFSQKGNLKVHLRTHTLEKPYICKICNKRFIKKVNLNRHMNTHTSK